MKKESGYSPIMLLMLLAIFCICLGFVVNDIQKKDRQKSINLSQYNIGDVMYIDGLNVTGKVNYVYYNHNPTLIDLLVVGTNGTPSIIEKINTINLKKVQSVEK